MSKHDRRKTLSYLNVFNYYDGGHEFEDNLTRAFLVLLKNSPFIMKRFVDVIVAHSNEEVRAIDWCSDLHEVKIESQPGKVSDEDLCEFTVPVIITEKKLDHIPLPEDIRARKGTRPDGVIFLKPNIALAIEIKRYSNVQWGQVYGHVQLFGESRVGLCAVNVTWTEVVSLMLNSLSFYDKLFGQEGSVSGIEKTMVRDFFHYLATYHPQLMPYDTLELCARNGLAYEKYLLETMAQLELGQATPEKDQYILLDDPIVKRWVERIYIGMDEKLENIVLRLYPADTTNQGKNFYKNVDLESVSSLVAGWAIKPLLHFAYMGTHLVYAHSEMELDEYLGYWTKSPKLIRQYKRDEFEALYSHLLRDRLINSADEQHLRMAFDQTKRGHINLCPGVEMKYVLPIESAKQMERESMLKDELRRIVNDAISICN